MKFGQKLEDFGLIVGVIVIAAMLIPLAVIASPLLLLGIMALRVLIERYPRVECVLRRLRDGIRETNRNRHRSKR